MSVVELVCALVMVTAALVFVYPYLIYPELLRLFPPKPLHPGSANSDGDGFGLYFCAYNEISALPEKLANLAELRERYPQLRVFAYDDASTDGTREALRDAEVVDRTFLGDGRTGKAHGMKKMAAATDCRHLFFCDANVMVDPDAIDAFARLLADESVGGICGTLHYLTSGARSATEASGGAYWRLEERIKSLESRTGNVMGADGSLFCVRAECYPSFPDTVQDDFTVSMQVVFDGMRLVRSPDARCYERLVSERGDEWRRKIRIAARAHHTHQTMARLRRKMSGVGRFKYFSHKVIRWWGAPFGLVSVISAAILLAVVGVVGAVVLGVALVATTLAIVFRLGPAPVVVDIVGSITATFVGVLQSMRGRRVQVWTPPATR